MTLFERKGLILRSFFYNSLTVNKKQEMLYDLIRQNRTYRRFYQHEQISDKILIDLIELARLSPSPKNKQSLKFMIINEEKMNRIVFPSLAWAGYLKDWNGPVEGERPSAYIIILLDKQITPTIDADMALTASGIVAQSIMLGAVEKNLGGCMIASVKKEKLKTDLNIDERFEIVLVLALGVPKEKVEITELKQDGDIKYYRDENQVHYVPKRSLNDIIIK